MTLPLRGRGQVPELMAGDRLSRPEFERRYSAMPRVKKAELVEGVVYMPSPVSHERHSGPHARAMCWLGCYAALTDGVDCGDNATVRLDELNEPQPDAFLRIAPAFGGASRTVGGYVKGPPELALEVTASRVSYDLHDRKRAYARNGIQEYVVWRVDDAEFDWFMLRDSAYEPLAPSDDGILQSRVFPGLWLDVAAMLSGDMRAVLAVLDAGRRSSEYIAFRDRLQERRESR